MRFLLLPLLFICFGISPGYSQSWQWHEENQPAAGNSSCNQQAIATDANNNTYATGSFLGTVTVGLTQISAPNYRGLYLVKYSAPGLPLWTIQFGSMTTYNAMTYCVTVDNSGDIYVGGSSDSPFTIGSVTVNVSTARGFLLKFNSSGVCQWAIPLGNNSASSSVRKVVFNASTGQLLAGGQYASTGYFGSYTLTGNGAQEAYLTAIDPINATVLWAKNVATSNGTDAVSGICFDANGTVFVTASFGSSTVTIGSQNLSFSNGGSCIVRFRSNGTFAGYYASVNLSFDATVYNPSEDNVVTCGRYLDNVSEGLIQLNHYGQSMQGDIFLCAFDTSSLQPLYYTSVNGSGNDYAQAMCADSNGIYLTLQAGGQLACQAHVLNSTGLNYGMVYTKFDGALGFQWSRNFEGSYFTNRINCITCNSGSLFISGVFQGSLSFTDVSTTYFLNSPLNVSGFLVRITDSQSLETGKIRGWVFSDPNANGRIDTAEITAYPTLLLQDAFTGHYSVTGSNGRYSFAAETGNHTVTLLTLPQYYHTVYPFNQSSQSVTVPSFTVIDSVNFGLQPWPGITDLAVTVTGDPTVRTNHPTRYFLDYENLGTDTVNGFVTAKLDSHLIFLQSVPPPDSVSGRQLFWNYYQLIPLEHRSITVDCQVGLIYATDPDVVVKVLIEPIVTDTFTPNNRDSIQQSPLNPHDPNFKTVSPDGPISTYDVNNGIWLNYTIHFQNTGTDTAYNVVLRDTLDNLLDLSSIYFTGWSAPFSLTVEPGRVLVIRFDSINLPDSTTNFAGSSGFIRFRIHPSSSATAGQTIYNHAFIFFDTELPIETNTTATPIQVITSLSSELPAAAVAAYPNPSSDFVIVVAPEPILEISLFNANGQCCLRSDVKQLEAVRITVTGFPAGLYTAQITTTRHVFYKKLFVVR